MAKLNLAGVSTGTPRRPPSFEPSPQQEAIFKAAGGGNLIIEARAGTGKTTTLIELCKHLGGGTSFLAFNKAIASDIGRRLAAEGLSNRDARAQTFHGAGFQAWVRHAPAAGRGVEGGKLLILAKELGIPSKISYFSTKLVSLAKQHLVGASDHTGLPIDDEEQWLSLVEHFGLLEELPAGDEELDEETFLEEALAWSLKLLRRSIERAPDLIDFDDMIYMPLYSGLRLWRSEQVLIDEAQDTNLARRVMATQMLAPGGQLVAVGDRHQAIYGFTGADADALDLIERKFKASLLPLTVSYRCAESIIRLAQSWVPDIEARPGAPEGSVENMPLETFQRLIPEPSDAILCRNTRPLVALAFDYLRRGIPCVIEGRDIGLSLITLVRRWKQASSMGEMILALEEWASKEEERFLSQFKDAQAASLRDRVETLKVLSEGLDPRGPKEEVIKLIDRLFKDSEGLAKQVTVLSTIHKAKGREWDRVFLLGRRQLLPSPYARQKWMLEQERNLCYVAVTRAKNTLIEVDLPGKKGARRA